MWTFTQLSSVISVPEYPPQTSSSVSSLLNESRSTSSWPSPIAVPAARSKPQAIRASIRFVFMSLSFLGVGCDEGPRPSLGSMRRW